MCELENAPKIQKYPKTFIHDCSLPSSSLLCTVFVSRISESEPGQYVVCNGHAMTAAENRPCMVTLLLGDFTSRTSWHLFLQILFLGSSRPIKTKTFIGLKITRNSVKV